MSLKLVLFFNWDSSSSRALYYRRIFLPRSLLYITCMHAYSGYIFCTLSKIETNIIEYYKNILPQYIVKPN